MEYDPSLQQADCVAGIVGKQVSVACNNNGFVFAAAAAAATAAAAAAAADAAATTAAAATAATACKRLTRLQTHEPPAHITIFIESRCEGGTISTAAITTRHKRCE